MEINKTFTIDAPQDQVWQFVSSPEKVGMCFPGCQHVVALGEDKYQATVKVNIGPIKTVFNVDFETTEEEPPNYSAYTTRGEEGNRASRLKAESTLTLSPVDDCRTQVVYTSNMSIVGRLGKFGLGVMKRKADSIGDEFVQALRMQIEGQPEVASSAPATTVEHRFSGAQKIIAATIVVSIIVLGYYFLTH